MNNSEIYRQARLHEGAGRWREAESAWMIAGDSRAAEICKLIAESNERAAAYREEVLREAGQEPVRDTPEWTEWYGKMSEIYKKHYPTS